MDIGELLSYKPDRTPRRPQGEELEDDDVEPPPTKRQRAQATSTSQSEKAAEKSAKMLPPPTPPPRRSGFDAPPPPPRRSGSDAPRNVAREQHISNVLQEVSSTQDDFDETANDESGVLDETGLKRMILTLEKKILRNQEQRVKYPDSPEKFMQSELELFEEITKLKEIATCPDLYPKLIQLGGLQSILEILSHANTDLSVAAIDLVQELTDVDILNESEEGANALVEALRKQQICALLVQTLNRLDESVQEEADGVFNTLQIFENLNEFDAEGFKRVATEQGLLEWLLRKLKNKNFDANKLYASEILSILLQNSPDNQRDLGVANGIDFLLQQVAVYKRNDPVNAEEHEFMENLFNCLCSALMVRENRDKFLRGEGLQLMNLMLREKKQSRNGALKVLDYAMSGPDGRDNCQKFVDILGLRTIFPLFMKTPKRSKKRSLGTDEHEEHVASIIASMLRNCRQAQRHRLLAKFTENEFEKVDRLLELHLKYMAKVEQIEKEIEEDKRAGISALQDDEDADDVNYLKKLSGGLFTVQLLGYILIEIANTSDAQKQRMIRILNQRGASISMVKTIMTEYADNLGEAGDPEWREQERSHILQLLAKI